MHPNRRSQFDHLLQQLELATRVDFDELTAMKLRRRTLALLNERHPVGMADRTIELVVCRLDIHLTDALEDEDIETLAQALAEALRATYRGLWTLKLRHLDEVFLEMVGRMQVKF